MQDSDTGKREIASRLATRQDIEAYYGKPERRTMRAMVVTLDGKPAGIAGLVRDKGMLTYFTEYKDELAPMLKDVRVQRAALKVMKWVRQAKMPVITVAQHDEGKKLIERYGFAYLNKDYYIWPR